MNKLLKEKDYFKSSDLTLITALCCDGYQVEAIDRSDPSRVVFSVRRNEFLDEVLQLYFSHQLKVDPLEFAAVQKELKTRIYHSD